jgi:hypothetical protein
VIKTKKRAVFRIANARHNFIAPDYTAIATACRRAAP